MKIDINKKIRDIYPKEWKETLGDKVDFIEFRNIQHFKNYVSKITQIRNYNCGVSYKEALDDLLKGKSQFDVEEYESVRNLVRKNLIKMGLISDTLYERYKYAEEGLIVDVGKYVEGDPECVLAPNMNYKDHFYQLYINMSYNGSVEDEDVLESLYKILATVNELQKQHIYIAITLIDATKDINEDRDSYLLTLPLFSYKEHKSIKTMSSVINERFLRKFVFAVCEDIYGEDLHENYGRAVEVPYSIQPVDINEIDLFTYVYNKTKGKSND